MTSLPRQGSQAQPSSRRQGPAWEAPSPTIQGRDSPKPEAESLRAFCPSHRCVTEAGGEGRLAETPDSQLTWAGGPRAPRTPQGDGSEGQGCTRTGLGPHGAKPAAARHTPPPASPGARPLSPPRPFAARTSCGHRAPRACLHAWPAGRSLWVRLSARRPAQAQRERGVPRPGCGQAGGPRSRPPRPPCPGLCQKPCVWRRKQPCQSSRTRLARRPAPLRVPPRWGRAGGCPACEGGDRPAGPSPLLPGPRDRVWPLATCTGRPATRRDGQCDPGATAQATETKKDEKHRHAREKGDVLTAGWPRVSAPRMSTSSMSTPHISTSCMSFPRVSTQRMST